MIALAFNLRLLQDQKSKKGTRLTRRELQEKILAGEIRDAKTICGLFRVSELVQDRTDSQ